jgi:hypothetical protein
VMDECHHASRLSESNATGESNHPCVVISIRFVSGSPSVRLVCRLPVCRLLEGINAWFDKWTRPTPQTTRSRF